MTDINIGNNLRKLRFLQGEMTQAQLAKTVGVTRQTIVALETSRYAPSLELAMKLACVFRCGVDDLYFWEDPEEARATYFYEGSK